MIKVRKDIGGVELTPSIVVVYFGKENNRDKLFRVKFGGLQEIREGLMRSAIQLAHRMLKCCPPQLQFLLVYCFVIFL